VAFYSRADTFPQKVAIRLPVYSSSYCKRKSPKLIVVFYLIKEVLWNLRNAVFITISKTACHFPCPDPDEFNQRLPILFFSYPF
jgi:hypothetical protein